MRILGIDPGLATMGYGVIEAEGQKRKVVQFGTINTRAGCPHPAAAALHLSGREPASGHLRARRRGL